MLLVFHTATGHVFVSTESTIGYVLTHVQLDLGEGLKLLVGVWMNHLYNNILKNRKAKGIHDRVSF